MPDVGFVNITINWFYNTCICELIDSKHKRIFSHHLPKVSQDFNSNVMKLRVAVDLGIVSYNQMFL